MIVIPASVPNSFLNLDIMARRVAMSLYRRFPGVDHWDDSVKASHGMWLNRFVRKDILADKASKGVAS